jgi:tyrosinase
MDIRKKASALTAAEKQAFVAAVLGLKDKPSVLHPTNAQRSRYDDYVEIHLKAMNAARTDGASWGHMCSAFGPWHRLLLRKFELDLQKIRPGVTIPYWDWTVAAEKTAVFTADFLGGNGDASGRVQTGPFTGAKWILRVKDSSGDASYLRRAFGRDTSARRLPTAAMVTSARNLTTYDTAPWNDLDRGQSAADWGGFRIQLEVTLHNLVHRYVGGTMVQSASPNDPVFWLHHANIDRLWGEWQDRHGNASYPTSGAPTGHNLNDAMIFHKSGQAPWTGTTRPVDTFDRYAMGFRYDSDPATATMFRMQRMVMRMPSTPRGLFPLPVEVRGLDRLQRALLPARGAQRATR